MPQVRQERYVWRSRVMGQLIRRCQHPSRLTTCRSIVDRMLIPPSRCDVICGCEIPRLRTRSISAPIQQAQGSLYLFTNCRVDAGSVDPLTVSACYPVASRHASPSHCGARENCRVVPGRQHQREKGCSLVNDHTFIQTPGLSKAFCLVGRGLTVIPAHSPRCDCWPLHSL